jgi:hypothetical protein
VGLPVQGRRSARLAVAGGNRVAVQNWQTGLWVDVNGNSYNAGQPIDTWYGENSPNQHFYEDDSN